MQKTGVKTERMQKHPSDTLLGCQRSLVASLFETFGSMASLGLTPVRECESPPVNFREKI